VPRQLPASPASFIGRADELARLDALLETDSGQPTAVVISAVSGTAGIGKTTLALHWAHRAAKQFPDGQLYVNLRGFDPSGSPVDPGDALRGFLDAVHVPPERIPTDPNAQAALYRSRLAGRRMLIVLDNARDTDQVRLLLPGAPGCLVLVTSRHQLSSLVAMQGAKPVELDVLSRDESRQLLASRLGEARTSAEPEAVNDIIARCARLPLALAIVAARAAAYPRFLLATVAGELDETRGRLDALHGGDAATDMRAVFSWSYQQLTPDAARLFRQLGLHPGPDISAPAAASLAALPVSQIRRVLAKLTGAHLIVEHSPGRYAFHDLLRAYATEQAHTLEADAERRTAVHRLLDHYLHTARNADRLLNPVRDWITFAPPMPGVTPEHPADYQQALAWFTSEHTVLLTVVDQAAGAGFDTHTWQLAWTLVSFLNYRGHRHDAAGTQRAAVAAARRLADPAVQARINGILGATYTQLGCLDDAHTHLLQALHLGIQASDQALQAHAHLDLAEVLGLQGRHADALGHARQARDQFNVVGDRHGQAMGLNAIGWCQAMNGDHRQALISCQQALPLFQELGDRHSEAHTWENLGYAHHHLGDHAQARTHYRHALDLFRDLGNRHEEAAILTRLGDTHHAAGQGGAARDAWRHALTILDDLGHPDAENVRAKLHRSDSASRM
jgi:tetratricopeptide (TPR) repeat protein